MEKKNTILLTVIAIATLLVAVVGATFAYFTATITTENEENKTTTIRATTLVQTTMSLGSHVDATDALPGYKTIRDIKIVGGGDDTSKPVDTQIVLTPDVTKFGSHIKYTVYKATATTADALDNISMTCQAPVENNGTVTNPTPGESSVSHAVTTECTEASTVGATILKDAANNDVTGTFSGVTPVVFDVAVTNKTNEKYFVLIEYLNDENANQNQEQGQTFTIDISIREKA